MVYLTPVNGGTMMEGPFGPVEVLGPGYSTHPTNIVCLYTTEGRIKVEVAYSGGDNFEVYRFKTHDELQHYWSHIFSMNNVSKKYKNMVEAAVSEYRRIFRV